MEEYWCVAVPGHNHYPQLAGRGVAVGGCSPRRFQPHQCLGQCCGSPGPHNGTYQKAAAPRSVGGGWYLVSSAGGRTTKHRSSRSLRAVRPAGIETAPRWDKHRPRGPETLHMLGKHKPAETPPRGCCRFQPPLVVVPPVTTTQLESDPAKGSPEVPGVS